jgi:DNA-binding MarR family transcriptional regulator
MAKTEVSGSGLVYALERLSRLMRAAEFADGLNPAQWESLRFLARANRFSNSPGALTRYLGATKGTISQTVKALERKKLIEKSERPGEKRSVVLHLTEAGNAMMAKDPWSALAQTLDALGGKTRRRRKSPAVSILLSAPARPAASGGPKGARTMREARICACSSMSPCPRSRRRRSASPMSQQGSVKPLRSSPARRHAHPRRHKSRTWRSS